MNIKWYLETWWKIIARPIYFYSLMEEENWQGKALSFLLITAWIIAAAVSLAIFIEQFIPIGSTLIEGIAGWKFVLILPVLVTLSLVFFMITLLIVGGMTVAALGAACFVIAYLLHYVYLALGGKGHINRMLQSTFYSSAIFLTLLLPVILTFFTKFGGLDFSLFRVGYNFIYSMTALYVYGLWAVAGRKNYNLPKWKAFLGAGVPILAGLIFGIIFDKMALAKLQSWITPLK